mgnify:CR=1 FL=1
MAPEIVGIGMSTVDHLYRLENVSELPRGGVLEYAIDGGGPAATAMAAAATLGAPCGMMACVGDDERGRFALDTLREAGVDVSRSVVREGGSTPMVLVLADAASGERHFLALRTDPPRLETDEIDWDYAAGARVVLVDNWVKDADAVLERLSALDAQTLVDSAFHHGFYPDWLAAVDVFIAGGDVPAWRDDPDGALEEAAKIVERGPHTAILTLGGAGCVGVGPEGEFRLPAFEVEVVDTCGTGDVFHGSYAYALNGGWAPRECALFASATASLSAMCLGGRAGLPTAERVAAFLAERGEHGPWED